MSDLRTLMHETAGPITELPTVAIARADRVRGVRALRRRRIAQLGGGPGLATAAAIGVFAIAAPSTGISTPAGPPTVASGTVESGLSAWSGTALVSYTGVQPVGYKLDKVPAGWTVRLTDASLLVLAPAGAPSPAEPSPAKDGVSVPMNVEGTITVSTQSDMGVPTGIRLDKVTVDGRSAVIAHMQGGGRKLFAKQPSGAYLEIRVWKGLGWNNDRIVEFAESVHATKDVEEVRG